MSIVLTDSLKKLLIETAFGLHGAAKRKFMAQTVVKLGFGGQRLAQRELAWNRDTIRKGIKELTRKLNDLGYNLRRVKKVLPQKKSLKLMQSLRN